MPAIEVTMGADSRTLREWGGWAAAQRHAREHGAAGVLRATGSYRLFFMEAGKLRVKTFSCVRVVVRQT